MICGIIDRLLLGLADEGQGFASAEDALRNWTGCLNDKEIIRKLKKEDLSCFSAMKFDATRGFVAPPKEVLKNPSKENERVAKEAKIKLGFAKEVKKVGRKSKKPQNKAEKMKEATEGKEQLNYSRVTPGMLDTAHRLLYQLHSRGFPTLSSIYRAITFINGWKEIVASAAPTLVFEEIDRNYGIAPERWAATLKTHFAAKQLK